MSFTPGTLISTSQGDVRIEDIRPGDILVTRDNDLQEVTFVRKSQKTGRELLNAPHLRPVQIRAGALGQELPVTDMMVTPNHRIALGKKRSSFFGKKNDLVAAKHLVNHSDILEIDCVGTTYIELEMSGHQTIRANGVWVENFDIADMSMGGLGNSQRNEIREIFPSVVHGQTQPANRQPQKRVANLKFW